MTDSELQMLIQQLFPRGALVRAWALMGGGSAHMSALEVRLPDGSTRRAVVRQPGEAALRENPSAAGDEFRLLRALQAGSLPTPAPYLLDDTGENPRFVMEYIEGSPDFAPVDRLRYVRQAAAALAGIHRLDTVDLPYLPPYDAGFAEKFAERADDSPETAAIRAALRAAWPVTSLNPPTLLHGDFWPGNLLWRDGELVAVVDWEDAKLGDPLADVAISRMDMRLILGEDAMHEFTAHYRSLAAVDFTNLPFWDAFAALRAAPYLEVWAQDFSRLGRPDITEHTMREAHRRFTAHALAQLTRPPSF